MVYGLPQLACRDFRNSRNPDTVSFAQLFPPVFDGNNLRTLAEGAGSVQAVWEGDRSRVTRDPFHTASDSHRRAPPTIPEDDALSAVSPKRPAQWGSEWGETDQHWSAETGAWDEGGVSGDPSTRSAERPLTSVDVGRGGVSIREPRAATKHSLQRQPPPVGDAASSAYTEESVIPLGPPPNYKAPPPKFCRTKPPPPTLPIYQDSSSAFSKMPLRIGGPPLGGFSVDELARGGADELETKSELGSLLSAVPTQIGGLQLGGALHGQLSPSSRAFQLLEVTL